jgi:hypothetical protein
MWTTYWRRWESCSSLTQSTGYCYTFIKFNEWFSVWGKQFTARQIFLHQKDCVRCSHHSSLVWILSLNYPYSWQDRANPSNTSYIVLQTIVLQILMRLSVSITWSILLRVWPPYDPRLVLIQPVIQYCTLNPYPDPEPLGWGLLIWFGLIS